MTYIELANEILTWPEDKADQEVLATPDSMFLYKIEIEDLPGKLLSSGEEKNFTTLILYDDDEVEDYEV